MKTLRSLTCGPKFLFIESDDFEKNLTNVLNFLIKKVIDNVAGSEVKMCKKLINGTILLKTINEKQTSKLIQLTSMTQNIRVKVADHKYLNDTNDLREYSEEEITKR